MADTQTFAKLEMADLESRRKSRVVADVITEALREGRFQPNDRLPPERVLADQLGVSRGVVREALSALQIAGLIYIRTGEGSFVSTNGAIDEGAAQAASILEENESPLELWEARRELEITLVRMGAAAASREHVPKVKACLDDMRATANLNDVDAYLEHNGRFHALLIEPVGNTILKNFASELIDATSQLLTRSSVHSYLADDIAASYRKHADIFEAYAANDAGGIRWAVQHHFRELERFYLRNHGDEAEEEIVAARG